MADQLVQLAQAQLAALDAEDWDRYHQLVARRRAVMAGLAGLEPAGAEALRPQLEAVLALDQQQVRRIAALQEALSRDMGDMAPQQAAAMAYFQGTAVQPDAEARFIDRRD